MFLFSWTCKYVEIQIRDLCVCQNVTLFWYLYIFFRGVFGSVINVHSCVLSGGGDKVCVRSEGDSEDGTSGTVYSPMEDESGDPNFVF